MEKNFVVYRSSAGSGKTFTLVKEYLKICLGSSNPMKFREILAITFTNKAASEMKSRILSALQALSVNAPEENVLGQILLEEIEIDSQQFSKRAKNILNSILHNYADFSVSTIDQFTHRLIRSFARELQIPSNFEVEMDADDLLNKVIALLIDKVGRDKDLSELLVMFTKTKIQEEKYYDIEREIRDFSSKLLGEVGGSHLSKLRQMKIEDFMNIHEIYYKQNKLYQKKLSEIAQDALQLIDHNGIEHSAFKRSSIPNWLKKIKEADVKSYDNIIKALDYCEKADLYPQKTSLKVQQAIDSIAEDLTNYCRQLHDIYEKENTLYHSRNAALKNLYSLALLNEIEKLLEQIKKEESIIHISDFNKKIYSVVDTEPVPFIYERIGEKYRHFMVDEFQDTSVLQYQNLLPLLENSLAEENFNMLVGDGKQAIYRWRGGEVEQFSEMPNHIHPNLAENSLYLERQQSVNNHFYEKNLSVNFRSTETIINFNNQFFDNVIDGLPERIQQIYINHSQEIKAVGKAGYVSVEFLQNDGYKENTVDNILTVINECINDGYTYKDIAVLCRKNKSAIYIADFLVEAGIKIISSESLLLSKSQEVKFLMCCLRFISNQNDTAAKAFMLEFLCRQNSLDIHSNYIQCIGNEQNFLKFIQANSNGFLLNGLNNLPLYELSEKLIRFFNLHKTYDVYVQSFLEQVYQFQVNKNLGLSSFLEWWKEQSDKIYIDPAENVDAVQILTVHKSKGLEFPVVIFPFADSDFTRMNNDIWVDVKGRIEPSPESMIIASRTKNSVYQQEVDEEQEKMLMDEINTTYVAFTRAVDRLYIYSKEFSKSGDCLNSTAKMIHKGLTGLDGYQEEAGFFEMGEKICPEKPKQTVEDKIVPEFISTDWRGKLSISLEAPSEWGNNKSLSSLQYGNMMHKLFSEIQTLEDVGKVISDFNNKGLLSAQESEKIAQELEELLREERISYFFQKTSNVKVETDILTPEGKTYRPDRVVFHEDRIEVVDFKSGAVEKMHEEQIRNYTNLIAVIENKPTKAYLIYLNSKEVIEVS